LATAQSQGGLTKDAILKGFDALLNVLNSSATTFNKQTDERVANRKSRPRLPKSATSMRPSSRNRKNYRPAATGEVHAVADEVSRAKLQEAKNNFAAALERRRAEIQQQRKEFETILG